MIHGEIGGCGFLTAIVALAFGNFPFPPLALAQFTGFVAFAADIGIVQIVGKGGGFAFHGVVVSPISAMMDSNGFNPQIPILS